MKTKIQYTYNELHYKRMAKVCLATIPVIILIGIIIHPLYLIGIPYAIFMSLMMHSEATQ